MLDLDNICLYNMIMMLISTKYSHINLTVEIFEDYFIICNMVENKTQYTHVLFAHLSYLQFHNYDNSSSRLSSIELKMKNNVELQYLSKNKIYFSSVNECKFVFDKLFTAYRTYQNNH